MNERPRWHIQTPFMTEEGVVRVPFDWGSSEECSYLEFQMGQRFNPELVTVHLEGGGAPIPFDVPGRGMNWSGLISTAAHCAVEAMGDDALGIAG